MKRRLLCLISWLFLVPFVASGDTTYMVKYKGGQITLKEFLFEVEITDSPLDRVGINEEYLKQKTIPAAAEMVDLLSDMVFFRVISKRHREEIQSDPALSIQVTARVAEYVTRKLLAYDDSQIQVSEKEIRTFYQNHLAEFVRPEEQKIAVLYRASSADPEYNNRQKALLEDLMKKSDFGENFGTYAKRYSQASTAVHGGELNWLRRGVINPILDDAVFSMKKGDIKGVVETPKGYFVIKSLDYRTTETRPLKAVEPVIARKLLMQREQDFLKAYRSQLIKRYSDTLWESPKLPGPEDVVLRIGQEKLTLANLVRAYPQLKGIDDVGHLRQDLSAILLNLLAYRDFQTLRKAPEVVPPWKLEMVRQLWDGKYWLDRKFAQLDRDYEGEAKAYYEKHRAIYHGRVPEDLAVIIFPVPGGQGENLTHAAFEKSRRAAVALHESAVKQGLKWNAIVEMAKSLDRSSVTKTTGMITEYPQGWEKDKDFINLSKGYVSDPIRTPEGYAIFTVTATGTPKPMPYDEALPKAMSVVKLFAFRAMRSRLRSRYLEDLNLQFLFPVSSKP